jgi:SAM-dependent methyltransferase
VNFVVADCDHFDWTPAYYDAVVAIFVQFADPEMRARLFSNMIRALKPGGVLILQGYSPAQLEYKTGGLRILPTFTQKNYCVVLFLRWIFANCVFTKKY